MQQHVRILAILHIVLSSLGILAGIVVLAMFGGLGALLSRMSDQSLNTYAGGALGLMGTIVMIVIFGESIPDLIAGIGLLNYRPWARILTIIISVISLPAFPLHTAIGIYGLWVLLSSEGAALFSRPYRSFA